MKKLLIVVTSVLVSQACFLACGDASSDYAEKKQAAAAIKFDSDTINVGELNKGDTVTVQFKYMNTGDALLSIKNVGSSCGCTKPIFDTNSIKSKERGIITTRYSSKDDSGKIMKTLVVESNTQPMLHVLYIVGNVH